VKHDHWHGPRQQNKLFEHFFQSVPASLGVTPPQRWDKSHSSRAYWVMSAGQHTNRQEQGAILFGKQISENMENSLKMILPWHHIKSRHHGDFTANVNRSQFDRPPIVAHQFIACNTKHLHH
jgi:hypothetical protein